MKAFSELTKREKAIECVRWIGVLPAAVFSERVFAWLTFLLVVRPVLNANGLSYEGTGRWVRYLVAYFLGGVAFVVVGALVAPRFRRVTSVVLALISVSATTLVHGIVNQSYPPVASVTVASGAGVAVVLWLFKIWCGARAGQRTTHKCKRTIAVTEPKLKLSD